MSVKMVAASGIPGGVWVEKLMSWTWWLAFMACLLALLVGGASWGWSMWWQNDTGMVKGARLVRVAVICTVLVGAAGVLANTLLGLSLKYWPPEFL